MEVKKINKIGEYAIPVMICLIIISGFTKRINVYSAFISGTRSGIKSVIEIFPALFALFLSVSVFRASGLCDCLVKIVSPVTSFLKFPPELVPFAILRPVSGSGSLAFASDILSNYGADSFVGRVASVMMGSTETTFYTVSVYFAATKTSDIRHTIKCALAADAVSMALSVIVCRIYY